MLIVEKVVGNLSTVNIGNRTIDMIPTTYDDALRSHRKTSTLKGREIAMSLPLGVDLHEGDIVYMDDKLIICIALEEEKLIHISPKDELEWVRVGYNIGNMHHPAFLKSDGVYAPYDEGVLRIIKTLGVNYCVKYGKLDGERAAASRHFHHGDHSHSHNRG